MTNNLTYDVLIMLCEDDCYHVAIYPWFLESTYCGLVMPYGIMVILVIIC